MLLLDSVPKGPVMSVRFTPICLYHKPSGRLKVGKAHSLTSALSVPLLNIAPLSDLVDFEVV